MRFYSHLIEIESLIIELDALELSEKEKQHLASLLDSTLHSTILNAILDELSEEDKRVFLLHLERGEQSEIWKFLNTKAVNIEEKIKKVALDLKEELRKDIKEAKRKSKNV